MGPLFGDLSSQKKSLGMTEHPKRLGWFLQRALGGSLLLFGELRDVAETQGGVHRAAAGSVGEASGRGEIGPEVQIHSSMHSSAIVSHLNVTLQKQLQTSDKRKGCVTMFVGLKFRGLGGRTAN